MPLMANPPTKPTLTAIAALALSLAALPASAQSQSAASEGQKIAFDRGKGNCLSCHEIKGGELCGLDRARAEGHQEQISRSKRPHRHRH
jgi:sulfur-oxidizing protein SoxX